MQSKESRACEARGYLGRLRRAMQMQVYICICWQLKLSGNANLRLYQCWFAFTHRSPIKNFCRLSFTRKNFASLRLRKNLVELRARLSLLVDKTTFQYSALTIHYTTIDGHAPPFLAPAAVVEGPPWARRTIHQRRTTRGKRTPWTRRIPPPAPTPPGKDGTPRTRPDQPHPHARQGRKKEGTTGAPGSLAPAAEVEGMPLTFWITPSASTTRGRHGCPRIPFRRSRAAMICITFCVYCARFRV